MTGWLWNAFKQTIEHFGEVHGVVYTVEPAEALELSFERNLSSLIALSEVLQNRNLDFCLLQSQLSALLEDTVCPSIAASYFEESGQPAEPNRLNALISMQRDMASHRCSSRRRY